MFENSGHPVTDATKQNIPKVSLWSKKTNKLHKMMKDSLSFIVMLGSDCLSSPGCKEAFYQLGTPPADQRIELGMGWVVPSHASKIWWHQVISGLGHHHGWQDFWTPVWPRNQAEVFSLSFSRLRHFQTNVFFSKVRLVERWCFLVFVLQIKFYVNCTTMSVAFMWM